MTPEELCQCYTPEIEALAHQARKLVMANAPENIIEFIDAGYGALRYGPGTKMSATLAYIAGQTKHLNIGFYFGTSLPDPTNLLEGTGKNLRHVKIRKASDLDNPALAQLIQAAFKKA
jgi:hypothetical protein